MTPGTTQVVDGHTFYYPTTTGRVSPRPIGHMHILRVQGFSLEGPLVALMGCRDCSKTASVKANPLLRNVPEGFTEAAWANFLAAAARRKAGDG